MTENVPRLENYEQVCVWPAATLGEDLTSEDFVIFMGSEFKTRVQYLEEIHTNPDRNEFGGDISGTGERIDMVFAVHNEDLGKFAIPRLQAGIRWIEDALDPHNSTAHLYPERFNDYKTW